MRSLRFITRGRTLRVLAGHAWVTVEGDPDDHFLFPGQRLALPARRRIVIEALTAQTRLHWE